jgi:hypothetical protein
MSFIAKLVMTGIKMSVQKPNYVALDNEIKKNTDYLKANKTYLEQIVKIINIYQREYKVLPQKTSTSK